jgi:hypothetical protein
MKQRNLQGAREWGNGEGARTKNGSGSGLWPIRSPKIKTWRPGPFSFGIPGTPKQSVGVFFEEMYPAFYQNLIQILFLLGMGNFASDFDTILAVGKDGSVLFMFFGKERFSKFAADGSFTSQSSPPYDD